MGSCRRRPSGDRCRREHSAAWCGGWRGRASPGSRAGRRPRRAGGSRSCGGARAARRAASRWRARGGRAAGARRAAPAGGRARVTNSAVADRAAGAPPPADRRAAAQIGVGGLPRLGPERHDPILASLALPHAHDRAARRRPRRRRRRGCRPPRRAARRRRSPRTARARRARPQASVPASSARAPPSSSRPTSSLPRNDGSRLARLGARSAATGLDLHEPAAHGQTKERAQRGELATDRHGVVLPMERRKVGAAHDDVKLVERRGTRPASPRRASRSSPRSCR